MRLLPCVVLAALTAAPAVRAQESPYLREVDESDTARPRRGPVWTSVGAGAGSEAFGDLPGPSPYSTSLLRPTIALAAGTTVGQVLRIGLEGFGWFNLAHVQGLESITALMLGARLYPVPLLGLYLRAAGGIGRYGLDFLDDGEGGSYGVADLGLAWLLGAGFDVPLGGGVSIGPTFDLLRINVSGDPDYRERVINLGLAVTFDSHSH